MPAVRNHDKSITSTPERTRDAWTSFKFTNTRSRADDYASSSEASSPSEDTAHDIAEEVVQSQLNVSLAPHHVQDRTAKAMQQRKANANAVSHSLANDGASHQPLNVNDSASFAYGHLDEDERRGGMLKVKDRKRRNTKMRFSFLMTEEGNAETGSKQEKPRPSLLDVEVPPAADSEKVPQGRDSSVEPSFYFDAMEDQGRNTSSRLCSITEAEDSSTADTSTIPRNTQSKPVAKEEQRKRGEIQQSSTATTSTSFVSDHEDDFDDMIVLTNIPYPVRTLPCTRATATTTARLKSSAFSLMKYSESEAIFSALMIRLERMLDTEIDIVVQDRRLPKPSLSRLARRLRDFLRGIKDGRVATGEESRVVEHELRMCEWMVEAAKEGVMHIRRRGCGCRPDWSAPSKGYH